MNRKIKIALFMAKYQVTCKYSAVLNLWDTLVSDSRYECTILYQDWEAHKSFLENYKDCKVERYRLQLIPSFDIVITIDPYFGPYQMGFGYNKWDLSRTKIIYLEYGTMSVYDSASLAHHHIYKLSWMTIVDCAEVISKVAEASDTDPGIYVVGHPLFDYPYVKRYSGYKETYKSVLWTPHCTILDTKDNKITGGRYSTFWTYKDFFADELPKVFPDVEFVYKPHPFIRVRLERALKEGVIDKFDYDGYLNQCASNPNVRIIETKDTYYDEFLMSSLLLNDSLSFMIEYLPTLKPMIVLKDDGCTPRTPEMEEYIKKAHYVASNETQIIENISKLLYTPEDSSKLSSRAKYLDKYINNTARTKHQTNSQYLADVISDKITKEITE